MISLIFKEIKVSDGTDPPVFPTICPIKKMTAKAQTKTAAAENPLAVSRQISSCAQMGQSSWQHSCAANCSANRTEHVIAANSASTVKIVRRLLLFMEYLSINVLYDLLSLIGGMSILPFFL